MALPIREQDSSQSNPHHSYASTETISPYSSGTVSSTLLLSAPVPEATTSAQGSSAPPLTTTSSVDQTSALNGHSSSSTLSVRDMLNGDDPLPTPLLHPTPAYMQPPPTSPGFTVPAFPLPGPSQPSDLILPSLNHLLMSLPLEQRYMLPPPPRPIITPDPPAIKSAFIEAVAANILGLPQPPTAEIPLTLPGVSGSAPLPMILPEPTAGSALTYPTPLPPSFVETHPRNGGLTFGPIEDFHLPPAPAQSEDRFTRLGQATGWEEMEGKLVLAPGVDKQLVRRLVDGELVKAMEIGKWVLENGRKRGWIGKEVEGDEMDWMVEP